jgi:hypothetical protein
MDHYCILYAKLYTLALNHLITTNITNSYTHEQAIMPADRELYLEYHKFKSETTTYPVLHITSNCHEPRVLIQMG